MLDHSPVTPTATPRCSETATATQSESTASDVPTATLSTARPAHDRMALRLLHAWMSRALKSDPPAGQSEWRKIFFVEIPELALTHDYLLYALLALSATQLSAVYPTDSELSLARFTYWSMALSEQQRMISGHSPTDIEPVTLAALLIAVNAFAMLRDREIEPYVAPAEWLEVSKGFEEVLPKRETIRPESGLRSVVEITLPIWDDRSGSVHPDYEPMLRQYSADDSESDMKVYEETLARISTFREAILANEPSTNHARRICIFAQMVPRPYIRFLREHRQRALVILACFFDVLAQSGALHIFGDLNGVIPTRETQAIAKILAEEWQVHLADLSQLGD